MQLQVHPDLFACWKRDCCAQTIHILRLTAGSVTGRHQHDQRLATFTVVDVKGA
jgi:hypothetical protein